MGLPRRKQSVPSPARKSSRASRARESVQFETASIRLSKSDFEIFEGLRNDKSMPNSALESAVAWLRENVI